MRQTRSHAHHARNADVENNSATADNLAAMNRDIAAQVDSVGGGDDCAKWWETLHEIYVTAITDHIPRNHRRPRKPCI